MGMAEERLSPIVQAESGVEHLGALACGLSGPAIRLLALPASPTTVVRDCRRGGLGCGGPG